MTIGPSKIFENVVIYLPSDTMKDTRGIELVAFSRAIHSMWFCLGNLSTKVNLLSFMKIGISAVYTDRRKIFWWMKDISNASHKYYINSITHLDNNPRDKSFQGEY